jgi:hypothetical protein
LHPVPTLHSTAVQHNEPKEEYNEKKSMKRFHADLKQNAIQQISLTSISKVQPTRCYVSQFIYFDKRSTCFRRFLLPSSGAKIVNTASGIVKPCCYLLL